MNKAFFYLNLSTSVVLPSLFPALTHAEGIKSITLETLKVTARQWEEEQIDTPVSTDLIQQSDIDNTNSDINILTKNASNIGMEQSTVQTRVAIRGVSGIDGSLQDPVGYFINGIALPLGGNQSTTLFNLQSLELVKGPQSTLYGRNTEAGAIKLETADPTWDFTNWWEISLGSEDGADGNAASKVISAGASDSLIDDKLAASIAVRIEDSQGAYYNLADKNNDGGETDKWNISTAFTYLATDDTDITLKSVIENSDIGRNRLRYDTGVNKTDRFTTNANVNGNQESSSNIHSLQVNHSFETVELVSITGLTSYKRDFEIDLDVTRAPLPSTKLNLENDAFSQEIRLSSDNPGSRLKWLGGLYLYDENSDIDFSISPMGNTTNRETHIDQQGQALFGQLEYDILPKWTVAFGGRYEKIQQSGEQTNNGMRYGGDLDSSEFLPTTSLSFKPNTNNNLYLSYAKGYMPGGYQYNASHNASSFIYDPEYTTSVELGWKNSALNNRLSSGVTVFSVETKDKQVVDTLPGFVQSISNVGKTKTYGVELNVDYQMTPELSAYANLGLQKSDASSYVVTSPMGANDYSGNQLPYTPEATYSIGVAYQQKQGLFSHLAIRGSDSYYFNSANTIKQSNSMIIDGDIGYKMKKLTLSLWGKNLTDEAVISRAVTTQSGIVVEDSLPRTIGLKLSKAI